METSCRLASRKRRSSDSCYRTPLIWAISPRSGWHFGPNWPGSLARGQPFLRVNCCRFIPLSSFVSGYAARLGIKSWHFWYKLSCRFMAIPQKFFIPVKFRNIFACLTTKTRRSCWVVSNHIFPTSKQQDGFVQKDFCCRSDTKDKVGRFLFSLLIGNSFG